jgi:hypothetical protein
MLLTIEGHPALLQNQEITMTTNQSLVAGNIRKATMIVCGLGLLVVASATKASAETNCPQWSTPVCTHWNLGPPASCTAWGCAADRQSDPPKKVALDATNPVRRPIGRPPIVTTGSVNRAVYAKQGFSGSGVHSRHF